MFMFDDIHNYLPGGNTLAPLKGGSRKCTFLTAREFRYLHFPTAPPLNALLRQICDEFGKLYIATYSRELPDVEEKYQKSLANLNNPMYMHTKFKEAYDSKDWLDKNDWVPDQYPLKTFDLNGLRELIMHGDDDSRETTNMWCINERE